VETLSHTQTSSLTATPGPCTEVCPQFHEAIELIGKRWTGAIVCALTERPMRLVEREVEAGTPVRVTYSLTATGEDLGPAIRELKAWAKRWKATG
jgi:DNA-binding HxlR family transcriptional regulator